ncbi:glycosyltransferase family 8 protein [Russula earlei]|uniref:Glycosyltransferase family 8 protein n=1 Tax=Russula earlei TaxID=71964 RepID=A0ACC0UMU1_9AGAM|nr:glycosyltransferase family 8 protein [Russula earlei]
MASPYAFVTLLTSDSYLPGALTLAAALKDIHPSPALPPEVDFQTVALVTPETVDIASIRLLRKAFDLVVGVEIIEQDNERGLQLLGRPDLSTVLTKLHIFRLIQYSKIIFLDADVLPIRPLSHLFTLPYEFSAVPDVGWPDIFNSGFMVLSPGEDKFTELITLSKTKGSWDGADQGLLNEWRGSNWNRLSFTYNTTPTAVYTYAPAYERFGSQISAIHFIGANKPWSSIPWRAPGSITAQGTASQPLQVYDYGSLVDRWYAVYDKHYRSQPIIPQAAYASTRYEAVWDQESTLTPSGAPVVPTSSTFNLEDLRRIAIEGFSGVSRTSSPTAGEGSYISLPLEGRLDLMRPRPAPESGRESGPTADGPQAPDTSAGDQLTYTGSSTTTAQLSSLYVSRFPHDRPMSDSGPYDALSAMHLVSDSGAMISPPSGEPWQGGGQPAATTRRQSQLDPTSPFPQDQTRSYYSAGLGRPPSQSYSTWMPSGFDPEHLQGMSGREARDMQGQYTGSQYISHWTDKSFPQSGQVEGTLPVGTYPQGIVGYPHSQRQFISPYEHEHHGHQPPPPQKIVRPKSPPLVAWNPAVEPPPNTAPEYNFPPTTYYPNVWDQSPSHDKSDSSPLQGTTEAHFTIPPPPPIPERLLQEKHYVNVLGERQHGETPSPDRAKIKPVFPWEDKPRLTPGRVFPSTDSPPPGQFLLSAVAPTSPELSPPLRLSPTQSYTSSPSGFPPSFSYSNVWDSVPSIQKYASRLVRPSHNIPPLAPAFDFGESRRRESALFRNYHEAGESSVDGDDEDTGDERVGSPQSKPRPRSGSSGTASQPHFSGKGKKKEYRSQGVQTIPKETRDQSVQVTILTDPSDADRSIKDKGERPPHSREGSGLPSVSLPLGKEQPEFPPSHSALSGPQHSDPATSDLPKLSPLGSPTGLRSPRYASPRGSSTNLAESTPRPFLYKSAQRPSTPQRELQRILPPSISRTLSSDTGSSPSSAGPPVSPEDVRPIRRSGGRVWDPARGVEIFKKGSEEVLTRFLKLGSWEEEKQSQSPA